MASVRDFMVVADPSMNCLLVMKIKWSLDINTGAVERSEAARARRLVGATVVGDDVIASTGYMKKQPR